MVTRPSFAACCQTLEVLPNLLILACSSVSYNSTGLHRHHQPGGSLLLPVWRGLTVVSVVLMGRVPQQLDIQFYQLKLPTVTVAMACSGAFMAFCCPLLLTPMLLWCQALPPAGDWRCAAHAYCCTRPGLVLLFPQPLGCLRPLPCAKRGRYCTRAKDTVASAAALGDIGAGIFAALGIGVFAVGAVGWPSGRQKVRKLKRSLQKCWSFRLFKTFVGQTWVMLLWTTIFHGMLCCRTCQPSGGKQSSLVCWAKFPGYLEQHRLM